MEEITYRATGKVQKVMFRQTLIRLLLKQGMQGGATNQKDGTVVFTVVGTCQQQECIKNRLENGKRLNDWNALPNNIQVLNEFSIPWKDHQVTTENVDVYKKWNTNVIMYI